MGSLNPVFGLPFALKEKGNKLISAYVDAVNLYAGQMCTKPGALIILEESFDEIFEQSLLDSVLKNESLPMLNTDIFQNYEKTSFYLAQSLEIIAESEIQSNNTKGKIRIFKTTAKDFLTQPELKAEAFGPASIVIIARDFTEVLTVAESMEGSLTASMLVSENDKQEDFSTFPDS